MHRSSLSSKLITRRLISLKSCKQVHTPDPASRKKPFLGDLANLKDSDSSLQSVLKLRDTIYSTEFRSFVQQVTGCPPLTDQVDCSCNIYPEGGHLLCHDDVIGSRCVSYIVYLTDPDLEWKASDGGALELYAAGPDEGAIIRIC